MLRLTNPENNPMRSHDLNASHSRGELKKAGGFPSAHLVISLISLATEWFIPDFNPPRKWGVYPNLDTGSIPLGMPCV
jgi:hypothetical protein